MKSGVYVITFPGGESYVGSSGNLRRRLSSHFTRLRAGLHNEKMQAAYLKYGNSAMNFRVLLLCSKENLLFYEQRAIDILNPSCNISPTAGSTRGVFPSAETRAKLSDASRGRPQTEEARKKRSESQKGRIFTDEHRAKLSASMRGRPSSRKGAILSEETRAKLSAAAAGKKLGPQSAETKAKASAALKAAWARRKAMADSG